MSHASGLSFSCFLFEATREGFGSPWDRGLMCPSSPQLKQYRGCGLLLVLLFAPRLWNCGYRVVLSTADLVTADLGITGSAAGLVGVFRLIFCVIWVSWDCKISYLSLQVLNFNFVIRGRWKWFALFLMLEISTLIMGWHILLWYTEVLLHAGCFGGPFVFCCVE